MRYRQDDYQGLEDLRRTLWFAASREREFAEIINRKNSEETKREIKKHKTELTPEILRIFISKIVVHEKSEKYSRTAEQKVEIYCAHIGTMENADNFAKTEMERTA